MSCHVTRQNFHSYRFITAITFQERMLKLGTPPPVTTGLIVANVLIFAYGMFSNSQNAIISHYGFVPNGLFKYDDFPGSILRLFSSMFITQALLTLRLTCLH